MGQYEEARYAAEGLRKLFPAFREWWDGLFPSGDESTAEVAFPGLRLLVVGGHKWLERRVKAVLVDEWKLLVTWMDADEAERGDLAHARNADLVVINAACIGHSAAERIVTAAKAADTPFFAHHSRGAGAVLEMVRRALAAQQALPA